MERYLLPMMAAMALALAIALTFGSPARPALAGASGSQNCDTPGGSSSGSSPVNCDTTLPDNDDAGSISVSADSTVILGENLEITYTVTVDEGQQPFDSVNVTIENSSGTVVAEWTSLSGSEGSHDVTWERATWNTGAHKDAYANPKNGSYTIKAIGYRSEQQKTADTSVDTKLVIEADFEDPKPSSGEISSGLDENSTDTGGTYIVAGLKPSSGAIVWDSGGPDFSNRMLENMDNDAESGVEEGKEIKSIHFKKSWSNPSEIEDGQYTVAFKNVLDQAGNEGLDGYADGVVTDWTLTLY